MRRFWISVVFLSVLLIILPLAGVMIKGMDPTPYLEFPPRVNYVEHAPFSWGAFILLAFLFIAVLFPLIRRLKHGYAAGRVVARAKNVFPWWGYTGILLVAVSWFFAWNRFQWFTPLQAFTFIPLWLGYILCINGLTFTRTGSCLLRTYPLFFLALFPLSSVFWWFFEYLNRFVQNWHYLGVENFSGGEYILHASLCFSTVLPAVQSTEEYLASFPRLTDPLKKWRPAVIHNPLPWGWFLFVLAASCLGAISFYPDYLFPMLWVAPFLVITAVQIVCGVETVFSDLPGGDWRRIWLPAMAALSCGFFWEMWNFKSLAHWEYSVPFVQRFHIFKMPLLGYGGYLPFGLECMVVAIMLDRIMGAGVYDSR